MNEQQRAPSPAGRVGFLRATAVILLLTCVGQAIGLMLSSFGPDDASSFGAFVAGMGVQDWLFCAFLVSSGIFLWLQRSGVYAFFRSMQVGVSLIALTVLAVTVGVLVPQIDNFEDPDERVPSISDIEPDLVDRYLSTSRPQADALLTGLTPDQASRLQGWRDQYEAFRWAEGYFIYHLIHPYGIGMPDTQLPPQVERGLERFGNKYGTEERDNRRKQMVAAFSGGEKTNEIRQLLKDHEGFFRGFFRVSTALHLNRTYKSNWFAALLTLLFVGVFFNTFKGRPSSWVSTPKVGFFVVHLGVMTLLIGGGISKLYTSRGILHMDLREPPQDEYLAYGNRAKPTRMPFALKLDRFARRDWPTLEVGFLDEQFTSKLPEYTLWPGWTKELDREPAAEGELGKPRVRLRVLSLAERAKVHPPRFWDAESRDDPRGYGPLAQISVVDAADLAQAQNGPVRARSEETSFLRPARGDDVFSDPRWQFRIAAAYGDLERAKAERFAPTDGRIGWIQVRDTARGEVEPTRVPIHLRETVKTRTGYTIEVQEATANFQLDATGRTEIRDARPLAEQIPRNPGVWVSITPPGGGVPERRLLLERIDWETHDQQKQFPYGSLVLQLEWERWSSAGPPRYLLHWGENGDARLISEDGAATPIELGQALALPGETRIVPRLLLHNARFDKNIEFLAPHVHGPHFDEDFYSTDPVGLEIEVTTAPGTPEEKVEVVKMASTETGLANLWQSSDERFYLRFFENDRAFPFEWRSVLSVFERGEGGGWTRVDAGPEYDREIRVNDYFHYRGYRFFQTNAVPELPTYSGIGVVYDPGIPVVLMGMYTIILGTVLAFLVRPIAAAYGKRARQEAT